MKRKGAVVLATDFGPASRGATAQALRFALGRGTELVVVHAVEIAALDPHGAWLEGAREMEARADEQLARLASTLSRSGVRVRTQRLVGRPGTVVVRLAEKLEPQLLVVGTRRLKGVRRFVVGSVAERILRHAPCPVLAAAPSSRDRFRRILHATDFSPRAKLALEEALRIAREDGASLSLVHVLDERTVDALAMAAVPTFEAGRFARVVRKEAVDRLQEIARASRIRPRVVATWSANIPGEIAAEARRQNADLVAIGTQGRTGIPGFLIGNTAERLARELSCSLLCVR